MDFLKRHLLGIVLLLMFAFTWPCDAHLGLVVGYGLAAAIVVALAQPAAQSRLPRVVE